MREGHDGGARFHFFDYCYFNRNTRGEPLRRREAVMLLAINWIEILVINEAKNVNKHSPIYNCLFFIWASFYVGLGPKFSLVKSASVDSKLPHQWSRYAISQTNFLTIQEIQNTFTLSTFSKSHEFQESSVQSCRYSAGVLDNPRNVGMLHTVILSKITICHQITLTRKYPKILKIAPPCKSHSK